jgi:hypothetical protein
MRESVSLTPTLSPRESTLKGIKGTRATLRVFHVNTTVEPVRGLYIEVQDFLAMCHTRFGQAGQQAEETGARLGVAARQFAVDHDFAALRRRGMGACSSQLKTSAAPHPRHFSLQAGRGE